MVGAPTPERGREYTHMRRSTVTGLGGVAAAFLGSLCCVGPLLFVTLGVGAGLASTFEPLRPFFGVLMIVLFAAALWSVYGRAGSRVMQATSAGAAPTGAPAAACPTPATRRRDAVILLSAIALAVVFWTFPTWSLWLL